MTMVTHWASWTGGAAKAYSYPGSVFPAEPTVTAQDATNAAKLAGLGYVAKPTTAWTTGQHITIGTFQFNWSGAAWAAGPHAFMAEADTQSADTQAASETYDPSEHTVSEVEEYVIENPEEAQAVLEAEEAGKNRVTLVNYLNNFLAE